MFALFPAKVTQAFTLFFAIAAMPALANCPTQGDVSSGIWLKNGETWLLREQSLVETGIVVEMKSQDTRRIGFANHYAHPMLFSELFMSFTSSKRAYEQPVAPLDDLESLKKWQSDFTVTDGRNEPEIGTVSVEFQKNRIERVGSCKYKVWEVLVREHLAGTEDRVQKVLYSPELKIVLKRSFAMHNSALVWDRGYDGIRTNSE
ncbi:hypothetical protein [Ruegeria sp. MALMAid1280]|uniref:hypothetical protein n=1 Tax=Ruegeria sp. MALMAid1280 TaxID=3411634 RepID=UPI003B9FE12F